MFNQPFDILISSFKVCSGNDMNFNVINYRYVGFSCRYLVQFLVSFTVIELCLKSACTLKFDTSSNCLK